MNPRPNLNPSPDSNPNPTPYPNPSPSLKQARGSRLLIVADSCYSGKLISRIRGLPPVELAH